MRTPGRDPDLVPNPRPRTPRFRPPLGPALLGLYPLHTALAGLVIGLVAGPRSAGAAVFVAPLCLVAAAALLHAGVVFRVPLKRVEDAELDERVPDRPTFRAVPATHVAAALAGAAVAVFTGALIADERLESLDATTLTPRDDTRLVGIATDPPRLRSFGTTVVPLRVPAPPPRTTPLASDTANQGESAPAGPAETVLVRVPDRVRMPEVRVGDEVAVRGRLRALRPGETFERRRGVHGVLEAERVRTTGRSRNSALDRVRRRAEDALGVGLDRDEAALARGMVLGQDHALPEDLRDAFRTSGLAHLLAASGQNVMLLAALVLALGAVVGMPMPGRLAVAIVAIAAYVPLAGAGPSIQRAGVMGAAGLVAALAGRPSSRWYALLLAAAATLTLNPRAVEDPGWQLSFAAVIAILALHRRIRTAILGGDGGPQPDAGRAIAAEMTTRVHRLATKLSAREPARIRGDAQWEPMSDPAPQGSAGDAPELVAGADVVGDPLVDRATAAAVAVGSKRVRRAMIALRGAAADVVALTVAATVGTAPLLCLHFGELSLVSLPANLFAAPAIAPVMWLGTLSGVLGAPAAGLLNGVATVPLGYLAWLGRAAAAVPHASVPVELPGLSAVVLAYAAVAVLCLVRLGERGRRVLVAVGIARRGPWTLEARAAGVPAPLRPRWATLAPLGVLAAASALLLGPGPTRPPDGPTLSLLDVGQGDAVLLQDGPRAALFDTGRPGAPLVAELRRSGVERLDVLVLTHSSSDHEGGLGALLDAMPVGMVLDGRGPGREAGGEGGTGRFEGLPRGMPRAIPEQGQRFSVGRIAVEILWPPPGEERRGDPNLTATVAVARTTTSSALLTADAESDVTLPLDLPDVDVLKVAHHGSDDPGLAELVERTTPRTALIPVGRNTYGHPTPATLQALKRAVPDVRRTDEHGTIRVPLTR